MGKTKKTECVVKRKGHLESYDEKKVYASVYSTCMICEYPEKKCERTASKVMKGVSRWFKKQAKKKKCVYSKEIMRKVVNNLKKIDKDASIIYKHHFDLS